MARNECPNCGRPFSWDGTKCCRQDCRYRVGEPIRAVPGALAEKKGTSTVEDLVFRLEHHPNDVERSFAAQKYAKGNPRPEDIPALRKALHDPYDAVARCAANALGKLRWRGLEAVDDLIAAANRPWVYGCPQVYCEAIEALLKISPSDSRLVPLIRGAIACSNYGIQKTSVLALQQIASEDAVATIYQIERFWGEESTKSLHFKKLMKKVLSELAANKLNEKYNVSSEMIARVLQWLER